MPRSGDLNNDYPHLLKSQNNITLLEDFKGAKKHHNMMCDVCNHKWKATPLSKRQAYKNRGISGCPNCSKLKKEATRKEIHNNHLKTLQTRGIEIVDYSPGKIPVHTKLTFKNNNCGHVFESFIGYVVSGKTECTECGKATRSDQLTQVSKATSMRWRETADEWIVYKSEVAQHTRSNYTKFKKQINPNNLLRGLAGVPAAYQLDHKVSVRFCFDNNIPSHVCADPSNLQMLSWEDNLKHSASVKGTLPALFSQYIDNDVKYQPFLDRILDTFPDFEKNQLVDNLTVNLYDKNTDVAVLIIPTTAAYANQKTAALANDIQQKTNTKFFMVFEDEAIYQEDIIFKKIKHYLKKSTANRIHARKCVVREIDKTEKKDFLNAYHIQGNGGSIISYGAFYNNELVAVMSFSSLRVSSGRVPEPHNWELSRFATHGDYRIPGIASKLLSHFKRCHQWKVIISYADCRWGTGNMYVQMGFDLVKTNKPDYQYIIDGKRKHRWNYRKDILKHSLPNYNPDLTEYQNMENCGFWRVWDCGTARYELSQTVCVEGIVSND